MSDNEIESINSIGEDTLDIGNFEEKQYKNIISKDNSYSKYYSDIKKTKPFFDNKSQLDLNCLWVSALISAEKVIPKNDFLRIAENYYKNIETIFN